MKTLYNALNFPLLAEGYARNGLSDLQIANNLGVKKTAFYTYQTRYPDFAAAVKKGRRPVDIEVENALLKRALGFEYEEKTTEVDVLSVINEDGSISETPTPSKIRITKRYVPPDVGAIAFWLKNRKSSDWKDKREMELKTGSGGDTEGSVKVIFMSVSKDKALEIAGKNKL